MLAPRTSDPIGDATQQISHWYDWLIGAPLQTIIALVAGALVLAVLRFLIARGVRSVVRGGHQVRTQARKLLLRADADTSRSDELSVARRVQRAETMGSVLRSAAAILVTMVVITVLANIWDWDLGPLLASAGVVGVALGFGAQTLVKDFLSGIFLLAEDQYGVGDVVDLGDASGVVEAVGLRVTQVRDLQGTLWYVRNGEVLRVGNKSQGWSRAFVEVLVLPDQDVDRALAELERAAAGIADDPDLGHLLLDAPAVTAYEDLSGESGPLRAMIKTVPGKQWDVQRAMRARIRERFTEAEISLALPHREVEVRRGGAARPPGPSTSTPPGPPGTRRGRAPGSGRAGAGGQDQNSNG